MSFNNSLWFCVIFFFCALLPDVSYAATQSEALASCQSEAKGVYVAGWPNGPYTCAIWTDAQNGGSSSSSYGYKVVDTNGNAKGGWYRFVGTPAPTCTSGEVVPTGTSVDFYASVHPVGPTDGITCLGQCELALNIGIGDHAGTGNWVKSGATCPSGTSTSAKPVPAVTLSQTLNADGSETYCDTASGKCVTAAPPTVDTPASSSSSHSTDSTSTTTTGATTTTNSSTSTTTTTSTDGGSGSAGTGEGGGSGAGSTSTTTTTGQTDKPASSSSTSTKCTTGVCDVGDADGNIGSVYTAGTDTPSSVYANFKSQVSSAPIIASATSFFTVNVSGSCPSWHIPGNKWWGEAGFDFAFFCDPAFLAILTLAGYLVLAVASFSAFRIALY